MFKLEYFFKSSNFLKMIEMLFTMVILIGLITTYVYADQWNYTNNPSRFQIDWTPGIQMPWATNNWGNASSFVLAYEPVWAIGATGT